MMNKKGVILLAVLVICSMLYFISIRVPYSISDGNVKTIYCEYYIKNTKIPVNEADKRIIISEISKMSQKETDGNVGTVSYRFVIELTDGHKVEFIQNTKNVIEIYSDIDNRQRTIKAPKTAEFIMRFIKDNKIEI